MKLYLFDDRVARGFHPFAATRPVGELLYGAHTLRERAERGLRKACAGHWAGADLIGFDEEGAPPALDLADVETPCLLLCSRVSWGHDVAAALPAPSPGGPVPVEVAGALAGWLLPAGATLPTEEQLLDRTPLPGARSPLVLRGEWLDGVWSLMAGNADRVGKDLAHEHVTPPSADPMGLVRLGTHGVVLAPDVVIEPGVVLDARRGPIHVDAGVVLGAHLRLAGPAFVGRGSTLFGGSISAVSLGPVCKVRGEVEESVLLGYSNKAHDGFLGHAYLGRWVNLGALTTNSDLKNNYGHVRLKLPEGSVDTGLTKVGCFLGDHVKTGIGTMLNTGTVVGAGSNLFGGVMPPAWVPPFSWGSGSDLVEYRFDRFLEVAQVVMRRRGLTLSSAMAGVLERAWTRSAALRG